MPIKRVPIVWSGQQVPFHKLHVLLHTPMLVSYEFIPSSGWRLSDQTQLQWVVGCREMLRFYLLHGECIHEDPKTRGLKGLGACHRLYTMANDEPCVEKPCHAMNMAHAVVFAR